MTVHVYLEWIYEDTFYLLIIYLFNVNRKWNINITFVICLFTIVVHVHNFKIVTQVPLAWLCFMENQIRMILNLNWREFIYIKSIQRKEDYIFILCFQLSKDSIRRSMVSHFLLLFSFAFIFKASTTRWILISLWWIVFYLFHSKGDLMVESIHPRPSQNRLSVFIEWFWFYVK